MKPKIQKQKQKHKSTHGKWCAECTRQDQKKPPIPLHVVVVHKLMIHRIPNSVSLSSHIPSPSLLVGKLLRKSHRSEIRIRAIGECSIWYLVWNFTFESVAAYAAVDNNNSMAQSTSETRTVNMISESPEAVLRITKKSIDRLKRLDQALH